METWAAVACNRRPFYFEHNDHINIIDLSTAEPLFSKEG